jgi:hypothetical protein
VRLVRLTRFVDRSLLAVDWNVNNAPLLRFLWLTPIFIAGAIVAFSGSDPNSVTGLSILAVGFVVTGALMLHSTWRFFKGYGSTRRSARNFSVGLREKDEGLNG